MQSLIYNFFIVSTTHSSHKKSKILKKYKLNIHKNKVKKIIYYIQLPPTSPLVARRFSQPRFDGGGGGGGGGAIIGDELL